MKNFKRVVGLVLSLVLIVTALSGCGSKDVSTGEGGTLVYLIGGGGCDDSPRINEALNKILKEKTGYTLEFKYVDATSYDLILSSGEEVDLVGAADWLNYWQNAEKGAFHEITDEDLKTYAPYIWENNQQFINASKYNGVRYGVPGINNAVSASVVMARGDLMDKYGIADLNSFENLEKYLQAVADNEPDMIPFDIQGGTPWSLMAIYAGYNDWKWATPGAISNFEPVYYRLDDPERKLFIATEQPEMKEFSHKMKEWRDKGFFSKSVLSNKIDSRESLKNGRSALAVVNLYNASLTYTQIPQADRDKWDIRCYYTYPGGEQVPGIMGSNVAISSTSKDKAGALKVLNELYQNKEAYRLLNLGFEGEHYGVEDDKWKVLIDGAVDVWSATGVKNEKVDLVVKPVVPGGEEIYNKANEIAIYDPVINCNISDPALRNIEVAIDEIFKTHATARYYGAVEDVDKQIATEIDLLKKAGIDQYLKAAQEKVDKFVKENNL